MSEKSAPVTCRVCGETLKAGWKICPACETPLTEPVCPQCRQPVKAHWKRCPECEALLVCPECGRRLAAGQAACPFCSEKTPQQAGAQSGFSEPLTAMSFVYVPGGVFEMGDTFKDGLENELPVHEVILDPFYMARYPVTQKAWEQIMGENPSAIIGDLLPVTQVTWDEAQAFAEKLSAATPKRLPFSLPTEAEWEYAARSGGKNEKYAGGENIEALGWYAENSTGTPQPIGTKKPNGLGLYDMSGNIWEWCRDVYREDAYRLHARKNPLCRDRGPERVIRGGSCHLDAWSARCTRRLGFAADFSGPALGLRLVLPAVSIRTGIFHLHTGCPDLNDDTNHLSLP